MAKYSEAEVAELNESGKRLYAKGFDIDEIATFIDVAASTVRRWCNENDWHNYKRRQTLALSEMRSQTLECIADVMEGKTPKIDADKLVKYAKAFETFSSKKNTLIYSYESYELLCERLQNKIAGIKNKSEKQQSIEWLKELRKDMDSIITELRAENNE